jgi:hypothetical protein
VGTAVSAAGLFLLSTMDAQTSRATASVSMAVLGLGVGLGMQVMVLAVQNSVPRRDLGTATSAVNFFRSIGSSAGVAAVGSLFTHRLNDRLAANLASSSAAGLGDGAQALTPHAVAQLPPAVGHAVIVSFAGALPPIFGYLVPAVVVAFVLAFGLREKPLRMTSAPATDN